MLCMFLIISSFFFVLIVLQPERVKGLAVSAVGAAGKFFF